MKKTLAILGTVLLVLALLTTVANAATEEELANFVKQPHKIAGQTKQITAEQKVEVDRFLDTHEVTDAQADSVIAKIKEGIAIMDKAGTADLDKLKTADKTELTNIAKEVAKILNLKLKINSSAKRVEIYENGTFLTSVPYGDDGLAKTGANYLPYVVASVIAIFAVATVIIAKKRTVNA